MKAHVLIAAALLSATAVLAHAQTSQDHESHHPNAAAESKPPPAPQPQGQGSMGPGASMMGMGNGMPMMNMMQMMMGRSGGMGGMATIDLVEGRIAFLKTELKITDAQRDTWNAFADTLRSNAKSLGELRGSMMPQGSLGDRLAWQEKWLTARAEGTRAIRTAYTDLTAKLSDEQKANAEQLLAPHMGIMSMMSGMGSGQMLGGMGMGQMGGMTPGQMPMMPGIPTTTGKMQGK